MCKAKKRRKDRDQRLTNDFGLKCSFINELYISIYQFAQCSTLNTRAQVKQFVTQWREIEKKIVISKIFERLLRTHTTGCIAEYSMKKCWTGQFYYYRMMRGAEFQWIFPFLNDGKRFRLVEKSKVPSNSYNVTETLSYCHCSKSPQSISQNITRLNHFLNG